MITKTYIQARLRVLITDREYCMDHGHMSKTMDLVKICTTLTKELNWHRKHGHNAHTSIVRRNAAAIRKLANTLGRKATLRSEVLAMVDALCDVPALVAGPVEDNKQIPEQVRELTNPILT